MTPCTSPHRLVVAVLVLLALPLAADTFTPTKLTDSFDGACNTDCSLREAIEAANQNPGADSIELAAGTYDLSLVGANEDANASGDLDIVGTLTITGLGAKRTRIDAMNLDRVFDIAAGASAQIQQLTIQNGMADSGGGVRTRGNLSLFGCQVQNNVATSFGGGVNADVSGSFFALDSALVDNTAQGGGGAALGVFSEIFNTTVSGNTAVSDFGGGIYVFSMTLVNLLGATFTGNSAFQGGAVLAEAESMVTAANTVLSGNLAPVGPECSGLIASRGHNLVRDKTGCSGLIANGDQTGTASLPLGAQLGPLFHHGGGTDSHRPLSGSPLTNLGSPAALGGPGACLSTDQRGVLRPQGNRCDIGAVEDDTLFTDGFESGNTSAWSTVVP